VKAKIIATIGPSSLNAEMIHGMIKSGVTAVRINTKYGSLEQYEKIIQYSKDAGGCEVIFDVKNLDILDWLKTQEFDYIALSFAETCRQIKDIRDLFAPRKIKIIAKIETDEGIKHIDNLIECSDGIMVARGDLGRNIPYEKVPLIQKMIIKKCNEKKRMVITATEMLLSMTNSQIPERAEASDVANAILDGSDYLMLSEETATGNFPLLSVQTMAKIINETEKDIHILDI